MADQIKEDEEVGCWHGKRGRERRRQKRRQERGRLIDGGGGLMITEIFVISRRKVWISETNFHIMRPLVTNITPPAPWVLVMCLCGDSYFICASCNSN